MALPAGENRPALAAVLQSAARLQEVVPDAVLVGGSAASYWAGHRDSQDHDHVVADLAARFEMVLEAIESTDGWVTNRVVPGKLILGELGGIEAGVRQMIRREPLEIVDVKLGSGETLRVPTPEETLRVKGFLVVRRNQTRDYLDVAALARYLGTGLAGAVLGRIDHYYRDQRQPSAQGVATQLVRQLGAPAPRDRWSPGELARYKGLDPSWADWAEVVSACRAVALAMAGCGL